MKNGVMVASSFPGLPKALSEVSVSDIGIVEAIAKQFKKR
jgi:hypothetical protein